MYKLLYDYYEFLYKTNSTQKRQTKYSFYFEIHLLFCGECNLSLFFFQSITDINMLLSDGSIYLHLTGATGFALVYYVRKF